MTATFAAVVALMDHLVCQGVERLVRNDLFRGRTPERYYDSLEWLYGWKVESCL